MQISPGREIARDTTYDYKVKQDAAFNALARRNRVIGVLRFVVPGIGIFVTGFLFLQIILANIAVDYGISGLRVDKDQVVIEQPRYGGVMPDGTTYQILADVARVRLETRDLIDLAGANIEIEQENGYKIIADANSARLDLGTQSVVIPGLLKTLDTDNVVGQLNDVIIDWTTQILTARGTVRFEFEDGSVIRAQSLIYNAQNGEWEFERVIYNVPGDGGI